MMTICNFCKDPFYNQAFEEFVFQTFREDDIFFLWQNSPAVVVGSYQNICREVHIATLKKLNIPIVRRISGGGTVYHDLGNVNYTHIIRADGPGDYTRCLQPVIDALNNIGVPARKNRICDIAVGDLKISGSAQRVTGGRVLHHGTLLFQSDLAVLDQITTGRKNDAFQSTGTASAICPVTNIAEHLAVSMSLDEFQAQLLTQVIPSGSPCLTLTEAQEAEVCYLRDQKYRGWEWTWGKTPPFIYEKEGTFAGVPIHASYSAKHGILSDAVIDYKAIDGQKASQFLNGQKMDPDIFTEICRFLVGDEADMLMDFLM